MTIRLSALVVAHNEEKHLPDCLQHLLFADEIVIILDKSTDHSLHIAKKYTDKVIEGSWNIEGDRRNLGIENCQGEWILEVDADERVSPALAEEIRQVISGATNCDYYNIPFDNYIGKRLVRYGWGCYWGVRSAPRLFKRGKKIWARAAVHPSYSFSGESGSLKNSMIHYVDDNISDMIRRFDRYTDANADDLISKGNIGSFWNNFRQIFSRFFKCYISRKGYKEGSYGFINGIFAGLYPIFSYLKAKERLGQPIED
jgi:glycosyltransferase involved in cell wall biosynthesis